jgi:hypothetical protein
MSSYTKIPITYSREGKIIIKSGKLKKKNRFGLWDIRDFYIFHNNSNEIYIGYVHRGFECTIQIHNNYIIKKLKNEFEIINETNSNVICHLKSDDDDIDDWIEKMQHKKNIEKSPVIEHKKHKENRILSPSPCTDELLTVVKKITGKYIKTVDSDDDSYSSDDDVYDIYEDNKETRDINNNNLIIYEFKKIIYDTSDEYLKSFALVIQDIIEKYSNGKYTKDDIKNFVTPELVIIFNDLISNGIKTEKLNLKDLKNIGVILESENIAGNLYKAISFEIPDIINDSINSTINDGVIKIKNDLEKFTNMWVQQFYSDTNYTLNDLMITFFEYLKIFDKISKSKIFLEMRKKINSVIYELITYKITYEFVEKSLTIIDEKLLLNMIKIIDNILPIIKKFCSENKDDDIYNMIINQTNQAFKIVIPNYCDIISHESNYIRKKTYISSLLQLTEKSDFYERKWTKNILNDNCQLILNDIDTLYKFCEELNNRDIINDIIINYIILYISVFIITIKRDNKLKMIDNIKKNINNIYDFLNVEDDRIFYIKKTVLTFIDMKKYSSLKQDIQFMELFEETLHIVDIINFDLFCSSIIK